MHKWNKSAGGHILHKHSYASYALLSTPLYAYGFILSSFLSASSLILSNVNGRKEYRNIEQANSQ